MSGENKCLICEQQAPVYMRGEPELRGEVQYFECRRCGNYSVSVMRHRLGHPLTPPGKAYQLSAFVRERKLRNAYPPLLISPPDGPAPAPSFAVNVDDALAAFPRTVVERVDRTLANLARWSSFAGDWIKFESGRDYPVGYAENDQAFGFFLSELEKGGYLEPDLKQPHGRDMPAAVRLTGAGWTRYEAMERARVGVNPRQAFVAMWFDPNMDSAYDQGIKLGIEDAGYDPRHMGRLEHNDRIDDRIIVEIRKSHFLVGEFTGQNQGAYLEVGVAIGAYIPVIWVVRKDEIGKCHFDTRQFNHILWETPEELRERLRYRIQATIIPPTGDRGR